MNFKSHQKKIQTVIKLLENKIWKSGKSKANIKMLILKY